MYVIILCHIEYRCIHLGNRHINLRSSFHHRSILFLIEKEGFQCLGQSDLFVTILRISRGIAPCGRVSLLIIRGIRTGLCYYFLFLFFHARAGNLQLTGFIDLLLIMDAFHSQLIVRISDIQFVGTKQQFRICQRR